MIWPPLLLPLPLKAIARIGKPYLPANNERPREKGELEPNKTAAK
jgi:hypothetical protein